MLSLYLCQIKWDPYETLNLSWVTRSRLTPIGSAEIWSFQVDSLSFEKGSPSQLLSSLDLVKLTLVFQGCIFCICPLTIIVLPVNLQAYFL